MSGTKSSAIRNVLLVDDDQHSLMLYADLLRRRLRASIHTTRYPTQALQLANDKLFDFIIVDVTIDYNGTPFGGLELYRALLDRYGSSSLLIYSRFITEELLKRYAEPFNFIESGGSPIKFVENLASTLMKMRRQQKVFVAMPFDKELDAVWATIDACLTRTGYTGIRTDREQFNASIVDKIFREIREAKLVVFVATGRNPNVFFETGFALALKKEIITVTDSYRNLPFDVRDRNAIEYGRGGAQLVRELGKRLAGLG